MNPIIQVQNTSFAYSKNEWIFHEMNFDVFSGEILGIIGKSGSGKTTLCHMLKGVIPHSIKGYLRGIISVNGLNVRKSSLVTLAKSIGLVFQNINAQLFANTVREEIQFGLRNLKMDLNLAEEAMRELKILDIAERSPQNLSMGQKQRVVLASIIAMRPQVLILDEPSVHLDIQNRSDLKNWLEKINQDYHMTILIASNDPRLIGEVCNEVLMVDNRSVVKRNKTEILELGTTWNWIEE